LTIPKKTVALALVIAAVSAATAGCSKTEAPSGKVDGQPSLGPGRRTTRGDLALKNLDDRITTLESRVSGTSDLQTRTRLSDLLLTRVQFLGTFSDFARIDDVARTALRDFPNEAGAHLLEARALGAVHRFSEAEGSLARAAALGADVAPALAAVHIAQGRELPAALAVAEQHAKTAPTLEALALWANAEAALGDFERADEHYRAALDGYDDVLPFPVAYVQFQRGVMWAEMANDPARALPYYVEAVARLPQYVAANVHLAELESAGGKQREAIERLRRVMTRTSDPEPAALLGELLAQSDPPDPAAEELLTRARSSYAELLARHPTAFLDHAAEFFMGPGADPARALELARENLNVRETPRAYTLAIEAARAADPALACSLAEKARPLSPRNHNLRTVLDADASRCSPGH
jgi:tetratricopeptide (TPR) repeat protein